MHTDAISFAQQWVQAWNAHDADAVARITDLHFTVEAVFGGIDTLVITYRNQNGGLVNEVLTFGDDGLVIEGHGTYLVAAHGQ